MSYIYVNTFTILLSDALNATSIHNWILLFVDMRVRPIRSASEFVKRAK